MPLRAQRLLHADFPRSLLHRNQHDGHQPDAAKSQGQRTYESQQHLESSAHDRELVIILLEVGDEYGSVIIRAEVVVAGEYGAHHAGELLMILPFVVHENAGDVLRVVEIAHRAERDCHQSVVVIVAALHFVLVNADHLKAHAVDPDTLPQSLFTRKKSPLRLIADHHHAGVLHLILIAKAAAAGYVEAANALVHRVDAGEEKIGESARVVLNGHATLVENRSDSLHHRHFVADVLDIRKLQPHFAARLCAARLQRRSSRERSDYVGPPGAENHVDGALEARAKGQQGYHRRNPPSHSEHRQSGAAA